MPGTPGSNTGVAGEGGGGHIGNVMVTNLPSSSLDALFHALAHPVRREILRHLREEERTVGELAEPFRLSRPAISKHLDVLEGAGLVRRIPDGRQNRCRIEGAPMEAAVTWLMTYARYWTDGFDRLERYFLENPEP